MAAFFVALPAITAAATSLVTPPELVVTWSTNSLAPATYRGRLLPSHASPIMLSAQLLDNRKVIAQPLAGDFSWYVNGKLAQGQTSANFTIDPSTTPTSDGYAIEIYARNYQSVPLKASLFIPLTQPQVVITTPLAGKTVQLSGTLLTALPYFFNTTSLSDLLFTWQINGIKQVTTDNTLLLSGTGVPADKITLTASAAQPSSDEQARGVLNVTAR